MGSRTIEKEEISHPLEEIFHFIFEHKEFAEKLRTNSGEARFVFWDSSLNKTIKFQNCKADINQKENDYEKSI